MKNGRIRVESYTIELHAPAWVSRLVPGTLAFALLVGTTGSVKADSVGALTIFQDAEVLSASAINANFAALQTAFNSLPQVNPACPWGYARDMTVTAYTLCRKGADEVVKVGTDATAFWMDRYEASVWSAADATGTQYGVASADHPSTFPQNGQGPVSGFLYAVSRVGVTPTAHTTWFQANVACHASGKKLPTADQWLMAASLTPDPGASAGDGATCLTSAAQARATGKGTGSCTSTWGVDDLVGNLSEWIADWAIAAGHAGTEAVGYWPEEKYESDALSNIASSAYSEPGVWRANTPVAPLRGGDYTAGALAGVFALSLQNAPSNYGPTMGFRCVILR